MKKKYTLRIVVMALVFLFSILYTLPSTSLWTKAFGLLSPDQQAAVPRRLLTFLQEPDTAVVKIELDKNAKVFHRSTNPLDIDEVLNEVTDTLRKSFLENNYIAKVDEISYIDCFAKISVNNIQADRLDALISELNFYSVLPLGLTAIFPKARITHGLDLSGGVDLVYQVDRTSIQEGDSVADAVQRSLEILRNRIDMYGIAEPTIQAQDTNRIRIQLPGVKNLDRVRNLIQSTAMLRFHIVIDQALTAAQLEPVDSDNEIVLMQSASPHHQPTWYKLEKQASVTGNHLKYARVTFDEFGAPIVSLEFNSDGALRFSKLTGSHIGEQLAIVLDNNVHSAPTIQSKISGGMAQISGRFSLEEAQNLSIILRAGALPASLTALESRVVGPTLGRESVEAGWKAGVVGGVLVLLYMLVFYKLSGVIANLAIIFNTLIIFSFLVLFGGTLTLPGIAGLILTIGVAVDANVIIFERIKEEFQSGKTVRASINAGFDRALSCILDSNITTLLTVAILYVFGSGPIRGFATTLGIGLFANIFTAVFCVKLALDLIYNNKDAKTISI